MNPLFKDVKEYNKYLLSLISIFVLLLTGMISYNYTNTSYAKWSSSTESKNVLKIHINNNLDKSGANEPKLTSNMIPVYYDETSETWKKADPNNNKKEYKWYDYNQKMWANAVTVFQYKEVEETKKSNDISFMPCTLTSESSTNASTEVDAEYKMSFTTTKASTFSFDYTMLTGVKTSNLKVTINDTVEINKEYSSIGDSIWGGTYNNTFTKELEANTNYTVVITAVVTSSNAGANNSVVLSNILLSNNYTNFSYENTGSKFTANYYASSSYTLDQGTGKYTLNLVSKAANSLSDNYVCPNTMSNTCDEIYKIIDVSYGFMWSAEVTDVIINTYQPYTIKNMQETFTNKNVGEEISMDDINTMWVWIPRYTYTYFNTNTPEEINIKFEKETKSTGTIKCINAVLGSGTTSQNCTDSTNGSLKIGTSTYTHPAFTFGDQELTGIWVGKFENSATTIPTSNSTEDATIIIKPDIQSLRYKSLSYQFRDIRQMEKTNNIYGFPQSSMTTFNWNGELTGDTNNIDTHMMKNSEWGAVAYLSHSKYGINKEININNSSDYYTGRSGGDVGGSTAINKVYTNQTSTTQYNKYGFYTYDGYLLTYNTNTKSTTRDMNKVASSTGNIYGIYDLSGGSYEYVMANEVNSSNQFYSSSAANWSTSLYPLSKYYDNYTYNTSITTYTRGKLGDATIEMAPNLNSTNRSWYSDYGQLYYSSYSWLSRGGYAADGANAGSFNFFYDNGTNTSHKATRSVLVIE